MYLFICVLDQPAHLQQVLEAWRESGVPGATILDSTGVRRLREGASCQPAPLFMGFSRLLSPSPHCHNTIFAVVPDMEVVRAAVAATEAIIGDFSGPHTGIAFAVPVEAAWGLNKKPIS